MMGKGIITTLIAIATFMTAACSPKTTGILPEDIIPSPREISYNSSNLIRINEVSEIIDTSIAVPQEGYTLTCEGCKVVLKARTCQGLAHARASLAQLAGIRPDKSMDKKSFHGAEIPDVSITDWPAFPIRGFMHDTGRNFRDIGTIKKELDLFSFYKINVFHWHLTDNPAWRIECRAYPQLNDPQYQRKGRDEGRFYTYDEIRDVIAYAHDRGIMVIPEIDMPGHSQYFDKTFGFSMASPEGMKVLEACLEEFMDEIPAEDCPYIHIGSDEVRIDNPDEFMEFCEGLVKSHGRIPIAWFPGLPSSKETISQIWSETGRRAAGENFNGLYLDSYMGYLNLGCPLINTASFYLHQLCSTEEYDGKALGGILCLWNDVKVEDKTRTFPHNGMPEGLLSFAQSSWTGGAGHGWNDPNLLPPPGTQAHKNLAEFERKISLHRDVFLKEWDMRWVANSHIPWKISISGNQGECIETSAWGGCIDLNALCRKNGIIPGKERLEVLMTTEIYVKNDTTITAWVGFDSPARSNRMSDGIGEQGRWECSARVFSGEEEIFPSEAWKEPGKYRYHFHTWHKEPNEMPYTDEQFFWTREPAIIHLKSGWNTISLHCPRVFNAATWVAAFVPVTRHEDLTVTEATGIKYR